MNMNGPESVPDVKHMRPRKQQTVPEKKQKKPKGHIVPLGKMLWATNLVVKDKNGSMRCLGHSGHFQNASPYATR